MQWVGCREFLVDDFEERLTNVSLDVLAEGRVVPNYFSFARFRLRGRGA